MKTKIISGFFAILMLFTLTAFAISCGEDNNQEESNPNPPNQISITNISIEVKDNSFDISEDYKINLVYEENKTLNINKDNLNVSLTFSDGNTTSDYTEYDLDSNVPSPIEAGSYSVKIIKDNTVLKTISVIILKKEIKGFETLTQTKISSPYMAKTINGINLINKDFDNLIQNNAEYLIIDNNSTIEASNVGEYHITFTAKPNYIFAGNKESVSCNWQIEKRIIKVNLNSLSIRYNVHTESLDMENPDELSLVADYVGPQVNYSFADSDEDNNEFIKSLINVEGSTTANTIGEHNFTITLSDANSSSYCFVNQENATITENSIKVTYNVIPCIIPKPILIDSVNGKAPHYKYVPFGYGIEPQYEMENSDFDWVLKFVLNSTVNNGIAAINASQTPYQITFSAKEGMAQNFIFEDDANNENVTGLTEFSYDFYIDKIDYVNEQIWVSSDKDNYIDEKIIINFNYTPGATIEILNVRNSANFAENNVYSSSTKAYFLTHGMMNSDSYINFAETVDLTETLTKGRHLITLIYVHSYYGDITSNTYDETKANYNAIEIPAVIDVGSTKIDIQVSWLVNNTDSSSLEFSYDGNSHPLTAEVSDIYNTHTDKIKPITKYRYYYCSTENGTYSQVEEIKNVGYYYAEADVFSNDENFELYMGQEKATTITSNTLHILPKKITLNANYSGTAISGFQQKTYFSYYTEANKTITYSVSINGATNSDIVVTPDNIENQSIINSITGSYEYSETGEENSFESIDGTTISAIGYYKLFVVIEIDDVNYIITNSNFQNIFEINWIIVDNNIDVSNVAWKNVDSVAINDNNNYIDYLLTNIPIGALANIHFANKEGDILQNNKINTGTLQTGINYAYLDATKPFIAFDGVDGYENVSFIVDGLDTSLTGCDLNYNTENNYTYTQGKLFQITKASKVIATEDMVWLLNYNYQNPDLIDSATIKLSEIHGNTFHLTIQHKDSKNYPNNFFNIAYRTTFNDGEENILDQDIQDVELLKEAGTYIISAIITIKDSSEYTFDTGTKETVITLILTLE